jgi:hypothetical protein
MDNYNMKDRPSHLNSVAGQMIFWLMIQLGLLGMGVWQVRMYDGDRGNNALEWMIGGQIATMALIFGLWMDRWDKVGIWIGSCWPMGILAGLISGREVSSILAGCFYVSIWFIVLGLWRWIGKNTKEGHCGLLGGLATLGGGLLAYLRSEFTLGFVDGWGDTIHLGPLTEGLWIVASGKNWSGSFLLYITIITGVIALIIGMSGAKKRVEEAREKSENQPEPVENP